MWYTVVSPEHGMASKHVIMKRGDNGLGLRQKQEDYHKPKASIGNLVRLSPPNSNNNKDQVSDKMCAEAWGLDIVKCAVLPECWHLDTLSTLT